jgi:hypothetical protein
MNEDLNLIGARYNIITLIFFIPYVLCQPPATVLLRKIGPRVFLASITIFWGATMIVSYLITHTTNLSKTANKISGLRLRQALDNTCWPPYHSWCTRSWILPRLRIPSIMLVPPLPVAKA